VTATSWTEPGYYPDAGGRHHPGPAAVHLPAGIRQAILGHARHEAPNEACGIIVGDRPVTEGGRPLRWVATRNALASPYRYEIDPADLLRLTIETDRAGEAIWGIVHSHVASPARPSPTDVRDSHYPEAVYVIASLLERELDGGAPVAEAGPHLRAWRIVDGGVHEVALR
jgi:proteasome lid subunit RPN8/RPN11